MSGTRSRLKAGLLIAIEQNNLKMLDLLLSAGTDANQSNRDGLTPLMAAQAKHQQEAITLLQKNGAVSHSRSVGDPD